jgi:DNA repair exonuclease SbcCD ATPase subunit
VLLSGEKDIYIFDEPESSQDKENRDILKDIMLKLKNNGKIVMLISHSEVFSEIVDNIFNI